MPLPILPARILGSGRYPRAVRARRTSPPTGGPSAGALGALLRGHPKQRTEPPA